MQPTPEQLSIVQSIRTSPSSLMISAYAGTAKTTTLQLAAPGIRVPALALAFNKKIADDIRPRLPQNFTTKTLNSLGHAAWARRPNMPSTIKIDDRKLGKLVTQTARDFKIDLTSPQWTDILRLVEAAQLAGISPQDEGQPLLTDTKENWSSLTDLSLDEFEFHYDIAHAVLVESNRLAKLGQISFDDQIYCPVILGGFWPQFPAIFVDESQDLSPLNHQMLSLTLRPSGRLVAVGDSCQAIYAFRGADSSSMDTMRRLSSNWLDQALTVTFRCPRRVVERQQQHAPGYTAWDGVLDGFIGNIETCQPPEGGRGQDDLPFWTFDDLRRSEIANTPSIQDISMAILCRNNAPLLSLAFKLLRRNIGCVMLGRDIGKGLQTLSKKLAPDDSTPINTLISRISAWEDHHRSLALANDNPTKAERISDQAQGLLAVAEGSSAKTAGELRAALDLLFSRTSGVITLSSIHRAKGLEFDIVVHLDPWRIPSKWALKDPIQLQQEHNLLYVAETRTKHTLLNLNLADFR
jgi:DNA helicase-2/ATP-dependent DNA helicase PcrA